MYHSFQLPSQECILVKLQEMMVQLDPIYELVFPHTKGQLFGTYGILLQQE
jgi:hypothetical protein